MMGLFRIWETFVKVTRDNAPFGPPSGKMATAKGKLYRHENFLTIKTETSGVPQRGTG
jgi:hypothetical protein